MTNGEKYLKDGVDRYQFAKEIQDCFEIPLVDETILDWLADVSKPTLTEDERVILRNINTNVYDVIGRDTDFDLYIAGKVDWKGGKVSTKDNIEQFFKDNVFQFIKERRRI